ncbi:MAG: hypothetical protein LBO67_03410 [Spirochaetaceae bacterium]|jgi:hypothetical protein|nr:hypothetical protein [Spirochaetaceae bacterium]
MAVVFMAELSLKNSLPPEGATPSNEIARTYNIYELYIGEYPSYATYWTNWGGWYDNPVSKKVEIYFGIFLVPVTSLDDLKSTVNALFIDNDYAYINLPIHPWLYNDSRTMLRVTKGYLSAPPDPLHPDNLIINNKSLECRLEIPSITAKLSDALAGLVKYSSFSFTLINNDGKFDSVATEEYFNSPAYIYKAWKDKPEYTDFIPLRYGIIESVSANDTSFTIECADKHRTLEEKVCKIIDADTFPFSINTEIYGKELPVVYGTVEIELISLSEKKDTDNPLSERKYAIAEKVNAVYGVYDKDDKIIAGYTADYAIGVITVTEIKEEKVREAKWARISGYSEIRIGMIITDIIERKAGLLYNNTNYDTAEAQVYRTGSPQINIALKSGNVKSAVNEVLKSDMAFLIQKNDGRFSMRRWGNQYDVHSVPSFMVTQKIERDFKEAAQRYFSSCVIAYAYNERTKTPERFFAYSEMEEKAEEYYHKLKTETFETRLTTESNARTLALRVSSRFSVIKDTVKLAIGLDTSAWNLLDTVNMAMVVNGREYSTHKKWIIKELDNAQDKITLEALDG